MEINEIKDVALELMDALASKKLGEVAIELEGVKIKIKAAAPAPVIAAAPSAAAAAAASAAPPQQQRPKRRRRTIFRPVRRSRVRSSARFILLPRRMNRRSFWSARRSGRATPSASSRP